MNEAKLKQLYSQRISELEKSLKDMIYLWQEVIKTFPPLENEEKYQKALKLKL